MPVDLFTRQQFEAALPHDQHGVLWVYRGVQDGEHTYHLMVPNKHLPTLGIIIRSSVHESGTSAAAGEDSIRCWLADIETDKPYGSKIKKYVTRVKGWEKRLTDRLRLLYKLGLSLTPCPGCKEMRKAFVVKAPTDNHGRFFQNCSTPECKRGFAWIEFKTPTPKPTPVPASELVHG
jgi:hypothetical protein